MIWPSEYSPQWQRHFAWFPTHVDDGENCVWLQPYWERYVRSSSQCDYCGAKDVVGVWERVSVMPA